MAPIGAMPAIASDLHVSEAHVGLLTAAYALVSVVSTVPLVRWTARWPRRRVLILTLVSLTVSQVLSTLSPGLLTLAASRTMCALTHGLMWSVIVPIGARLVPPNYTGRAAAAVYAGTSAALIVGNPATDWMSQTFGWRPTVALFAAAAAVITVAARLLLPVMTTDPGPAGAPHHRRLRNGAFITVCVVTLIGVTGHFTSYTFVVPILRDVVGLGDVSGPGTAWLLSGYGIAGLIAMTLLAHGMDRRPRAVVAASLGILCTAFWALSALPLLGASAATAVGVGAVLVWGATAAVLPPMLQSAAIRTSTDADGASAVYVTAFQIGILLGSSIGGLVLEDGGIASVVLASAVLFSLTLAVALTRLNAFRTRALSGGAGVQTSTTTS